jgi:tripartite-type tricarboxylate transporter receptor subunit TctC
MEAAVGARRGRVDGAAELQAPLSRPESHTASSGVRAIIIGLLFAAGVSAAAVHAQTKSSYPNRPVRIVVPMAAGGGSDSMARLTAQRFTERFGPQFVVDNRGGGGGMIGIAIAVQAPPDGHTLMLVSGSYPAFVATHKSDNDPINNLAPVVKLGYSPFALVVTPSLPANNVKELIDYARARPGKLAYPVPGVGSLTHLVTELFALQAGIKMLHVPYKSTGLGIPDLLKGETHVVVGGLSPFLPHIQQGRLRALAVTTEKRWYAVPDVPTLTETMPGFVVESWFALVVPRATPAAIVAQLNEAANQMLAQPDTKKALDALGIAPSGGTSAELGKLIREEYARAAKVIREANIRAE